MNRANDSEPDAPTATEPDREPPTTGELLRTALVNADDPRFPWWLPLPGLTLALAWAGYRAASTAAAGDVASPLAVLLETLLWPGAAIFVLTSAATWFGWQLEID
jgi:hypothetical protein